MAEPELWTKIFKSLRSSTSNLSNAACYAFFNECIQAASLRTREYLHFTDPENKFRPSSETLREIFLMTYIQHSIQLNLSKMLSCTVMTQAQRHLLGADWIWAMLDLPSKNPRIQIAVQVLHLQNAEEASRVETVQTGDVETSRRTRAETLVEFCESVGRTCFALFLFFGHKKGAGTICGLLSNNLHEALGRCVQINQEFIEGFFKGAKGFVTAAGMMQAVTGKKDDNPLTMLVKFN